MNKKTKHTQVLVFVVIICYSVLHAPLGYAAETAAPDRVLDFLKDVVQLDTAKYSIFLTGPTINHPDELGGLSETVGYYTLTSENNKIEVGFRFINDTLVWCLLTVREGSPFYTQSMPVNSVVAAQGFLQRFQAFSGDSSLQPLKTLLDNVDPSRNMSKSANNVTLEVAIGSSSVSFMWGKVYNGAFFSGLGLHFQNGSFSSFGGDWSYVQIGSTEVNVSKENATSIALNVAKNFSWTYNNEEIKNFTILNDKISAQLLTKAKDKPLVLYPYWMVTLPLDNLYPGFVSMIVVEVWADTKQIIDVYPLGIGGDFPASTTQPAAEPTFSSSTAEPSSSASTTPAASSLISPSDTIATSLFPELSATSSSSQTSKNYDLPTELQVLAVAAVITVGIVIAIVFLKRQKRASDSGSMHNQNANGSQT